MSQEVTPSGQPEEDDLQFSSVEPSTPEAVEQIAYPQCVVCHQAIADQYYAVGDKLVCPPCRDNYDAALKGGSRLGRLSLATLLGGVAALVGAAIWFGIRKATGYDFALVAIGVGLIVGGAVRAGSSRRGGRGYQILAVLLTYLAVGVSYAPDFVMAGYQQFKEKSAAAAHPRQNSPATATGKNAKPSSADSADDSDQQDPSSIKKPPSAGQLLLAVVVLIVLAILVVIAGPIIVSFASLIEALIIAFALWEAWKINARKRVPFAGPYSLEATMPPSPPAIGQVQ